MDKPLDVLKFEAEELRRRKYLERFGMLSLSSKDIKQEIIKDYN